MYGLNYICTDVHKQLILYTVQIYRCKDGQMLRCTDVQMYRYSLYCKLCRCTDIPYIVLSYCAMYRCKDIVLIVHRCTNIVYFIHCTDVRCGLYYTL